jgi:hypothetical protein
MEKAGMRRERAFREHNAKSGSEENMVMYGLLRDEAKPNQAMQLSPGRRTAKRSHG